MHLWVWVCVAEKLILVRVNPNLMLFNTKINRSRGTVNSLILAYSVIHISL